MISEHIKLLLPQSDDFSGRAKSPAWSRGSRMSRTTFSEFTMGPSLQTSPVDERFCLRRGSPGTVTEECIDKNQTPIALEAERVC